MTAPTTYQSAIDALFKTQSRFTSMTAVYLIGGGALVAASLLAWAYPDVFSKSLGVAPWAISTLTLIWAAVGGVLLRAEQRKLQACTQAYDQCVRAGTQWARTLQAADVTRDPISQGRARYHVARAQLRQEIAHEIPRSAQPADSTAQRLGWLDLPDWMLSKVGAKAKPARMAKLATPAAPQLPLSLFGAYAVLPSHSSK